MVDSSVHAIIHGLLKTNFSGGKNRDFGHGKKAVQDEQARQYENVHSGVGVVEQGPRVANTGSQRKVDSPSIHMDDP